MKITEWVQGIFTSETRMTETIAGLLGGSKEEKKNKWNLK